MGIDATEAISVKVNINQFEIRLVVGYGAQESDRQTKLFVSQLTNNILCVRSKGKNTRFVPPQSSALTTKTEV